MFFIVSTSTPLRDTRSSLWHLAEAGWSWASTLQIKPKYSDTLLAKTWRLHECKCEVSFLIQLNRHVKRLFIYRFSAIHVNLPLNALFLVVQILVGLVAYATFAHCDPLMNGEITASDQILPYLIMKLFADIPVVRGIFISSIFAAALR